MLEKPDVQDTQIIACLHNEYGLNVVQMNFLPIGADRDTAVFHAIADNTSPYFVKLRSGDFDEMSIIVPKMLHEQGSHHIIAPLSTRSQQLWVNFGDFKLAVFPFVEGHDGYEITLLDRHWVEVGHALKMLHTAQIPASVSNRIQREKYSDKWRETVREFQLLVEKKQFTDTVAGELAAFLKNKKKVIRELIRRAEHLASVLKRQSRPFVVCHADIHAGNVFIDTNNHLYIVDWDTLILAPKERDLMFVGGGLFRNERSAEEEDRLFYEGYGQTQIDPVAIAYYRYERIVEDIAAYCEQLLLTDEGGKDRENSLRQLMDQLLPGHVIETAYRSEKLLPQQYKSETT